MSADTKTAELMLFTYVFSNIFDAYVFSYIYLLNLIERRITFEFNLHVAIYSLHLHTLFKKKDFNKNSIVTTSQRRDRKKYYHTFVKHPINSQSALSWHEQLTVRERYVLTHVA